VSKRNFRMSGALLLVLISLVSASLACYSDQVPGVFELTPYYTETPLPKVANPDYKELQIVLAPREPRAFFYLTVYPEPLMDNITNSKAMCRGDSAAEVLYAGLAAELGGNIFLNHAVQASLPDLKASNGVIHGIDSMLMPPSGSSSSDVDLTPKPLGEQTSRRKPMATIVAEDPRFSTLNQMIEAAGLTELLAGEGPFTLFAPTNQAIAATLAEQNLTLDDLLKDQALVLDILKYHLIVGQALERNDLAKLNTIATALGQDISLMPGNIYYLVDCEGSVGWVSESRLYGPLVFSLGELALALPTDNPKAISLLDDDFRLQPAVFGSTCEPETIVKVSAIQAADPEADGSKRIDYEIYCATSSGTALKGWVTEESLFGPLEMEAEQRAVAITLPGEADDQYPMSSEAGPVTDETKVDGCVPGAILQSSEVKLNAEDKTAYYKVNCNGIEGWVSPSRFVGPLLYDEGMYMSIYIPSQLGFKGEVPPGATILTKDTAAAEGEEEAETEATDTATEDVIEYIPPLYITSDPGAAILEGDNKNVVGQCANNAVAEILDYASLDQIYYQISCDECTETEVNEDGETVCKRVETREGWVEHMYLQGQLEFSTGTRTFVDENSAAILTENDGRVFARIPLTLESAFALSPTAKSIDYAGRCLRDEGVQIVSIQLEKALTSDKFNYYYQVECIGETATMEKVVVEQAGKPVEMKRAIYEEGERTTISGWMKPDELVPMSELEAE